MHSLGEGQTHVFIHRSIKTRIETQDDPNF